MRSQLICGRFIGESIGRESVRGEREREIKMKCLKNCFKIEIKRVQKGAVSKRDILIMKREVI